MRATLPPFKILASLWLLQFTPHAHAEQGCPPGMLPASGTNINSCVPAPGSPDQSQQQNQALPSQPVWASRWGAIATYAPTGILGTSRDEISEEQAKRTALADCKARGGVSCKIDITYGNQCAAVVVGDKGYNVNPGATQNLAIELGMKICAEDGGKGCHAYYSACSPAVRIN